jgi:L-fuconolactonase
MTHALSRRRFLTRSAAGLTALAAARLAAVAEGEGTLPIIDTHQHLWDLKKFRLPWLKQVPKLNRSFLMEDYVKATGELGVYVAARVVKAVYMEVDVAPEQQQAEADYVLDLCRRGNTPTVAAVVSGRPASDDFARYVTPFKGSPFIKGIRQVLHDPDTPPGYCLDPKFVRGIRLLGELGLSFDLCMRAAELPDAARLLDACPDTRFILDHCGNADVRAKDRSRWQKDIAEVAKRKNVVCKVSGIVVSAAPGPWGPDDLAPIVHHTLNVFGPERVLFGGDWPVCTLAASLRQWVEALRAIVRTRPEAEQRRLFHDNAVRVYRLG